MASRKELQAELLIMFGELIAPLAELVRYPESQTPQTRAKGSAKFTHDRPVFYRVLNDFCKGEKGHDYAVENSVITGKINGFTNQLVSFRDDTEKLAGEIGDLREVVTAQILAIPCELDSELFDAFSPFTSYMKIKSIVETAIHTLVFVDPYFSQNVIRRYFYEVPEGVELSVVTMRRKGGNEFDRFIELSQLVSTERGQEKYRLMYHGELHDRYLQCDDIIYHLGGSIKDAGDKASFTITKVQANSSSINPISKIISESSEQFGPTTNSHPRA